MCVINVNPKSGGRKKASFLTLMELLILDIGDFLEL